MRVLYEKKGHVAYITLNNPEKANILDRPTADELSEVWKETWEDMDVRVAILTAVGQRHFCAGHNLARAPGHYRRRARAGAYRGHLLAARGQRQRRGPGSARTGGSATTTRKSGSRSSALSTAGPPERAST